MSKVEVSVSLRENRFQGGRKSALNGCNSHFHMYAKTPIRPLRGRIYLNNRNGSSDSTGATTEIRRSCTIHVPLDKKNPIRVDSEAEHSTNNELDFYQNVDPLKQIYCIVSFSSNSAMASLDMNIRKVNRWVDQHGTD